jgi:hypothetical protein
MFSRLTLSLRLEQCMSIRGKYFFPIDEFQSKNGKDVYLVRRGRSAKATTCIVRHLGRQCALHAKVNTIWAIWWQPRDLITVAATAAHGVCR